MVFLSYGNDLNVEANLKLRRGESRSFDLLDTETSSSMATAAAFANKLGLVGESFSAGAVYHSWSAATEKAAYQYYLNLEALPRSAIPPNMTVRAAPNSYHNHTLPYLIRSAKSQLDSTFGPLPKIHPSAIATYTPQCGSQFLEL